MAAEAVLTFAAEGILNKVLSLAAQEFGLAWGFKAQLRKLQKSFTDIERFLVDVADQPQGRSKSIEEWVKNLKDVAEDAEDVLDEFEYEVARRKVEIQNHMKKKVLNFFSLSNPLAFRLQMAHKIQKINASLVDLERKASFLGLVSQNKGATPQGIRWDRQTDSRIGRDGITVGRGEVVTKIVTTLTDSKYNQENPAVMAIVGMGGLGKTTLAKSVYNEALIHRHFETGIWVCVSDTFDVDLILLKMLEQLKPEKVPSSKDNREALLKFLNKQLKAKRYILVLDDVWNEDSGKWENLMECLSKLYSAAGSKIVVTTRSGNVASISEKLLPRHDLEHLSVDECWSIIKDGAFLNSSDHITQEFQTVGKKIAENCGGVPLAANISKRCWNNAAFSSCCWLKRTEQLRISEGEGATSKGIEGMAAEAVLTFAAEGILNKVLSLAAQEFGLAWGFKAQLRKLQKSFTDIERFSVDVADQPQGRSKSIEEWVKNLKDVAEDAEDVLDEFEYEVARRKVEIQNHMKKKVLNFFSLSNPLAFRLQMAHKIQKINASLVDLERKASFLGLVSQNKGATPQGIRWDRQTDSRIGRDGITVGRGEVVTKIVTTLTDSKYNQENPAVMAIVGMGGLGKTTLAKSVYNEALIHRHFETGIWVCVSDTFDVDLILLKMLEQLKPEKVPSSKDNREALLKFLNKQLKAKRYILVLDDVWNEDSGKWENLMECLSKLYSAAGSKIVVTTRSGNVASISEKLLPRHDLEHLSVDECWSIIKDGAFLNSSDHITHEFQTVGMEIAKNCGGVPLVAKVLGGILHTKGSIEEWSSLKNSKIWHNLSKEEDRIMPVLKLSFDNLESPSLKQCFSYCSVFKKDSKIQKDNLIQLWMAQGLLHPSCGESKDMEDIGDEYFNILLHSSLFQEASTSANDIFSICQMQSDNGIVSICQMHDLVHDLAELVSKSESLIGDLCGIDNTNEIRHVARVSTSMLEKISKISARKLRSLFFDHGEVPSKILSRFKALRVLNLSNANIEEFPISIGRLKHLRYLNISKTRFKALPKSIGKLYNLQTLRATDCALEEFPKELQNLINLRHIYFDESTKFPQGLKQLTCLQTLPYFSVGNEIGRQIEELADLKQLRGELIICNLEHVKNGEEAKRAKLEDKRKICHLSFQWTEARSITNNNEEGDVLEGLRPHSELESLSIANFMGDKFPSWMMSRSLPLNNLKKIQLLGCDKCEGVPPLGHLPNLTELKISGMANLKCVEAEFYGYDHVHNVATTSKEIITLFPALKVLYIYRCGDLIEWKEAPAMSTQKVVVFPCLEKLTIDRCSKLRNAPSHFPFLQNLEIISCDSRMPIEEISSGLTTLTSLRVNCIKELTCLPQGMLKNNNNLSSLEISDCDDLTCFASDVFGSCVSLVKLMIRNCKTLRYLADGLDTLPLLEELEIKECPSLELIPITQGMSSLRELEIDNCERLSSLPSGLEYCTSLQNLTICKCDGVTSFPFYILARLRRLYINECNGLSGPLSVSASLLGLIILSCNNLTSIEIKGGVSSLEYLNISGCPRIAWFGVQSSSISPQSFSDLRTFTSLRQMTIDNCEGLESWVSGLQFPLSLEMLFIYSMPNLQILPSLDSRNSLRSLGIGGFWEELDSFPDFEVGSLMHLTSLTLFGWPKLKSLPQQIQHLTSLTDLAIESFEGVETLPEWLGSLTSLTVLDIVNCKNLINLPSVQAMQRLTKLHTLWTEASHPLLKQRCSRDSGTDWPKISHIPFITIDWVTQQSNRR